MCQTTEKSGYLICQPASSPVLASASAPAPAQRTPAQAVGCFKLARASAMTVTFKAAGELRIAHGRAWVTLARAALDTRAWAGDHFLLPEQTLAVKAGQAVVLEAMGDELYFNLLMDAKALVRVTGPTMDSRSVPAGTLPLLSQAIQALLRQLGQAAKLKPSGAAQSAHACGQTHPHPFATATLGCQS